MQRKGLLLLSKAFVLQKQYLQETVGILMKREEAIQATKALAELAESYKDLYSGMKGTSREAAATKKLWREGNKSKLIKIGVACIMFPDPSPVGEIIGAGFIAAGLVQKGIQKQSIYIGDIKKTFESTLKEVCSTKHNLRI
jgi:hypothetical protein